MLVKISMGKTCSGTSTCKLKINILKAVVVKKVFSCEDLGSDATEKVFTLEMNSLMG